LEGLIAWVQLLVWPMINDHFMTAKLLETDLGLAVKICEGADTVPSSTELARVIAESMSRDQNIPSSLTACLSWWSLNIPHHV
ncbi:hypothetical protein MKX01_024182, partial [Papaver californicum]